MDRDEIVDQLTEDVVAYVMNGSFPERELAQTIKPKQLDDRFEEYELLLDFHFILKPEVVSFVKRLPQRVRGIRTETKNISRTCRGEVDGRINWGDTYKKRYAEYPKDHSIFVCENRSEDYDIDENIVLKKLISVIYTTLMEAEEYLRDEYKWVQETWKGNEDLIEELQQLVERNVHVRRIRQPDAYEPTERMLTKATSSRKELYRDAAELLKTRNELLDGNPDSIRDLIDETAITPDDENVLFELYVLFRFVAVLEEIKDQPATFSTIATGRQEVARLQGDREVVLYHDNSGRDRKLSFRVVPEENKALSRTEKVPITAQEIASDYFQRDFHNHTSRPDVIVLEVFSEKNNEYDYLVVETKNSTRTDTIRQGIKETLEYLAFLRVNDDFVFGGHGDEEENYFGNGHNGLLVVQDLNKKTTSIKEQSENEVNILQVSELNSELENILKEVVNE
ncbi:hypothetical protein [Natranaeroarchaeum sulfidigenes]|uniref:Uncharacterized protein n=1 Tax=Natranaeroarchaeum sulfidigenes TaxID=2784880 RepID=A0A897MTB5_9EURY|nr:hypothetical protein [Natranaeroarchaeum sulfidigenes]QSG03278.1 Uncharacterized protein AArcS_2078 [Natranaeroarchaeum sulfidigenes]